MPDTPTEKALARSALSQARAERLSAPGETSERTAALLELASPGDTVAAYVSFGSEPDTSRALAGWLAAGVRVLLPLVLADRDLEFRVYDGALVTGRLGMACPPPTAPIVPLDQASLVVVPALACDRAGRRLGRGGGSYDRALPRAGGSALTVAVVYPEEVWAAVPVEDHDQRVRAVLAGAQLVHCR
jgi:5-formyltetrahydrofolate cyclo-ligase